MTLNFFQENGCFEVMTPTWQMISCPGGKTAWRLNSDINLYGLFATEKPTPPPTTTTTKGSVS